MKFLIWRKKTNNPNANPNPNSDKYIYKKTAREKMFTFEEGKTGSWAPEHVSFVSNLRL